ncbi:ArdA-like antirestriction protein [Streptomyces phage Stella]|nr:ArdA-like antirestriction protein [Streptomyces phage Stella]
MTNLSLFVTDPDGEHKEIDLGDVWAHADVIDEDSMHAMLVNVIAVWALENGNRFDDITPMTVDDDDGQELEIHQEDTNRHLWIREVVQLFMHLLSGQHYCDDEAILAYVDDQGWKWTDFESDLESAEDGYHGEFDGDYDEFAREYMSDMGESLDDHLESHFDYESYGESLVDGYDRCSWGSREFLFNQ